MSDSSPCMERPVRFAFCFALAWLALAMSPAVRGDDCANENTAIPFSTPTSDFTLNPDGTATHHKTGLIWDRCLYGQSGEDCAAGKGEPGVLLAWGQALVTIKIQNGNSYKGHSDWRMPNVKELQSIIEYRCWGPAFNTTVFPNFPTTEFAEILTSTPASAGNPFTFNMYSGYREYETPNTAPTYFILVRGGRSITPFDAQFPTWILSVSKAGSGSGTVTDTEGNCAQIEENDGKCLVAPGSDVSLHVVANPGSMFTGWSMSSGSVPMDCDGTLGDCAISAIAASGAVTANFLLLPPPIIDDGFENGF